MARRRSAPARSAPDLDPIESFAPERDGPHPRTRVLRQRSGEAWELWLREPPPPLVGLVAGLWAGDGEASYARHRVLPNGELALMFNLGPPQRLVELGGSSCDRLQRTAFISGLQEGPCSFESVFRHPRVVCARLLPLGARAFLGGLPLLEVTNEVLDLESVLGSLAGVEPLRQRLVEAPDLGVALDLVEGWLVARLLVGPAAHPATRTAMDRLTTGRGDVRVGSLARELEVSSRHLNGLFRREVGMSAKRLARILRFGRALEHLAGSRDDLASLAQACGYYDQAHLNRDFRDLAGLTPTEYLASRLPDHHDPHEVRG